MIWRPKAGMRVQLRYSKAWRSVVAPGLHESTGVVIAAGAGPGPINARVQLDDGRDVGVPRGNLFPITPS